jgi:acetyl esterase/lipase
MLVSWLVLTAASLLLFLSAWIVIPPPLYSLLVVAIITPEISAWLCVAGILVCVLARGPSRLMRAAFLMAASAVVLASIPLARAPFAIHGLDAEMSRALGPSFLNDVPPSRIQTMRERPIVVADLFRGIAVANVLVTRGIVVGSPGGQALTMTVYRPWQRGLFPAIVQIYGGAWQHGAPDDNGLFARYFASRGYVVFAVDYRHAPRWTWPAQMDDLRTATAWIQTHAHEFDADVARVAVVGRSAGAQLALMVAYGPHAFPVRAVVNFYGPVDLADGYRHPPSPDPLDVHAVEEAFLAGTPDTAAAQYRDASPLTYVNRPLPPTLNLYGARDQVVEARWGRLLHERLMTTGTVSILLELPWAEHAFDAIPNGPGGQIAIYYVERFLAWALTREHRED